MNNKTGIKVSENFIGSLYISTNTVDSNSTGVAIFSGVAKISGSRIVAIEHDNFYKNVSLFASHILINKNWTNYSDEYLAPNESHPKFSEFVNDSVVFSLFDSKSNQSSLRNVEYKSNLYNIKNEFFWMPRQEILNLAEEYNKDVYNDALNDKDRYVYNYLQSISLSTEAKELLDYATELVRKSFKYRKQFNEDNPKYQINNWDSGYYQLKALWKEYMPEEFSELRSLFKKLADKMKPQVYELGFLKQ